MSPRYAVCASGSIPGASTEFHQRSRWVSSVCRTFCASHEAAGNAEDRHPAAQARAAVGQPGSERFTVEVSAADMAVLWRVLSLGWGHDAPADIGESVAAIVKAYLRFVGSSPSIKAGLS